MAGAVKQRHLGLWGAQGGVKPCRLVTFAHNAAAARETGVPMRQSRFRTSAALVLIFDDFDRFMMAFVKYFPRSAVPGGTSTFAGHPIPLAPQSPLPRHESRGGGHCRRQASAGAAQGIATGARRRPPAAAAQALNALPVMGLLAARNDPAPETQPVESLNE